MNVFLGCCLEMVERIAAVGTCRLLPIAVEEERALVVVDVDRLVLTEVDGVGARAPRAVVVVGIKDLRRERLPPAGRSAEQAARPPLPYPAKAVFEIGKQ